MGQAVACSLCNRYVMAPASRLAQGAVIGNDFAVEKELARGGMGTVYLAQQISLERPIALKILHRQFSEDPVYIKDFLREARAAAQLNHPAIVQAYAVGEENGIFYFAMEYVKGTTVKNVLTHSDRMVPDRALSILKAVCEALNYAWVTQRIVHRDIKPDNIMLTDKGGVKLADLGLAKKATDVMDNESDEVAGTPHYMSPEQILLKPLDCRSDMYSLGATFYKAVTGDFPFTGETPSGIAMKHLGEALVPPNEKVKAIADPVSVLLEIMMAKRPEHRHPSYDELIKDIDLVMAGTYPKHPLHPQSQFPLEESGVAAPTTTATTRTKRRSLVKPGTRPAGSGARTSGTLNQTTGNLPKDAAAHPGAITVADDAKPSRNWKPLIISLSVVFGLVVIGAMGVGVYYIWWNSLTPEQKEMRQLKSKYGEKPIAAYLWLKQLPAQKKSGREIMLSANKWYAQYPRCPELALKVAAVTAPYVEDEIQALRRERYGIQLKRWQERAQYLRANRSAETERIRREQEDARRRADEEAKRKAEDERRNAENRAKEEKNKALWDGFQKQVKTWRATFAKQSRGAQFGAAAQALGDLEKSEHGSIKLWAETKRFSAQNAELARGLVVNSQVALKGLEFSPDPRRPQAKVTLWAAANGLLTVRESKVADPSVGVKVTTTKVLRFDDLALPTRLYLMDQAITRQPAGDKPLDPNLLVGCYLLAAGYVEEKMPGQDKDSDPTECRRRLEATPKTKETEQLLHELKELEAMAKRQELF